MTENNPLPEKGEEGNLAAGAKGGAVAFGLKMAATLFGFLNQIVLARILGAGGVGEILLALTVVKISTQIAKFGMEEAMMRFIPLYIDRGDAGRLRGTIRFALSFSLLISILFIALVLIFSKFISINIFHSEGLLKLLPVVVVAIPVLAIRDVIGGILKGYKDTFRALVPENFVSPFFRLVIFLLLILKGASPFYAIVAFVSAEILAASLSIKFLLDRLSGTGRAGQRVERKKIIGVAYTIIFTSMSVLLYTQADIWILGMFTPTDTVGIYGISAKLVLLVYFPMMAFSAIVPPLISSIHTSGNLQELRKVVSESTRWILSMAMPVVLILLLEGKLVLRYAYGPEFEAGYAVLVILTAGQLIKAGSGLIGGILQMTGEHRIYMKINIIWGVLNIILNIFLVPRFGMIGAAAATAFCLSMIDIICIFVVYKRLSILTLPKGLSFDLVFIAIVAAVYLLFNYIGFSAGQHLLLFIALTVYLWKSITYNDIPWRFLVAKYKEV